MAGKYFGIPFAMSGDRTAIPDAAQPDGSVSFTQGFTLDYELENTDPSYKPVPREETNALYYDITEAVGIVQKQGFADWTIYAAPYPVNAFVRHSDIVWRNTIAGNSAEPGTDLTWSNESILTDGISGSSSALKLSSTGLSALVAVTANSVCLKNSANEQVVLNSVSVAPSLAASGVNGLDTGVSAINTWYYVWVIWNGTTTSGLLSLSSTSPAMPVGYTYKARVGAIRSDGTADKFPLRFDQYGNKVVISPLAGTNVPGNLVMAQGVLGTINGTGANVSVANFIPPTAGVVEVFVATQTSSGVVQVGRTGTLLNSAVISLATAANQVASTSIALDGASRNITFASNIALGVLACRGWEDNL